MIEAKIESIGCSIVLVIIILLIFSEDTHWGSELQAKTLSSNYIGQKCYVSFEILIQFGRDR